MATSIFPVSDLFAFATQPCHGPCVAAKGVVRDKTTNPSLTCDVTVVTLFCYWPKEFFLCAFSLSR